MLLFTTSIIAGFRERGGDGGRRRDGGESGGREGGGAANLALPVIQALEEASPRPHPSSPPALLRGLGESGCVGSGWRAGWSSCILCPHIPAERPRRLSPRARGSISSPTRLPPPLYFFTFPTEKARKDASSREGFPLKNAVSPCAQ